MKPTAHISVDKEDVIAKTVLLPGDPLRAKFIAENFLSDVVQFNAVRNMFGYTGTFKGKKISVMGTGMGMPSIGIYASELIKFYGVENLIRIGSAGSFSENVNLYDIVIGMSASTNSNFVSQYNLPGHYAPTASHYLFQKAVDSAKKLDIEFTAGNILSSDIFYDEDKEVWKKWQRMGVLCVEMEAAALYMIAARHNVNALGILTISDSLVTNEATSSSEREKSFTNMMKLALNMDI